ncbi:MAG TPA: adenosylcobinamide-GDP ribazoletransferase [Ktedonobacterales bacterium]
MMGREDDHPLAGERAPDDGLTGKPVPVRPPTVSLTGLPLALQFLTVLPVATPSRSSTESALPPRMDAALPWFPLVGALIGIVLAAIDWVLRPALSLGVRSAIVLVVAAGVTGMLHLDGFIDCCDGLLGARSTERRLAILRDSRAGAYGVVGGCLLLLLRFAALTALARPDMRVLALIAAPLLGRWSMVYAIVRYPYARPTGVGAPFRASVRHLAWASVLAGLLLAGSCAVVGWPALPQTLVWAVLAAGSALLTSIGATVWMSRRLDGGLTGDTYGALNECVEVVILVLFPLIFATGAHPPFGAFV